MRVLEVERGLLQEIVACIVQSFIVFAELRLSDNSLHVIRFAGQSRAPDLVELAQRQPEALLPVEDARKGCRMD